MAQISRPVAYGSLAIVAIAGVWYSNQDSTPLATPKKVETHRSVPSLVQADFLPEDYTARFEKPHGKLKNLFVPLVDNKTASTPPLTTQDPDTIPASFANGEPNWKYTGMAEINGVRSALLQDSEKHHGGFIAEGEHWKTCRIARITNESIVLTDGQGQRQVVMRFSKAKPKSVDAPAAVPGAPQPVNPMPNMPMMHGPIGPNNIIVSPMPPGVVINGD